MSRFQFLGLVLGTGQGVEQDAVEAGVMFKELAEKGHPFAQVSITLLQNFKHLD